MDNHIQFTRLVTFDGIVHPVVGTFHDATSVVNGLQSGSLRYDPSSGKVFDLRGYHMATIELRGEGCDPVYGNWFR